MGYGVAKDIASRGTRATSRAPALSRGDAVVCGIVGVTRMRSWSMVSARS